ncbi:Rieske (2Fe-2S) protein [Ornithinimicrobium pekingense]|uniref:Cytochrome bc1 complex Rieske iron-sulfur subunit n=1 Tax=Ornithinimicrobium pekingense TaxID=384677 RepID=A0ABQ2FCN8_9MICO|nr:Rieske (2Fe-2S) protein [Ornithinimicrobium pekingense]GGK74633.1 hypothetical protein GCM10011509_24080 [Ornithinimicrobium pekingense]
MPDQPTDTGPARGGSPVTSGGTGGSCCASRRTVLCAAAGLSALAPASAALTACGSGDGQATGPTVADDGTVTVPVADTAVGEATYYGDAKVVVTHPSQDDYRAFDATCPHQGCATSSFDDGVLVCPCHGSEFDPATGDVVGGPAPTGLRALTVTRDGDDLQIRG